MRRFVIAALLSTLLLVFPDADALAGGKVRIKLGTLAPKGSPYYDLLAKMGQDWREVSGGKVQLKIYPGGVAGYEGAMVRKMRTGRLHAATLTSSGIMEIDATLATLQVPRLLADYEELEAALAAIRPLVEQRLGDKGFEVLHIGDTGWVRFFTREPVTSLEQMRQQKLFVAAGDQQSKDAWKAGGFTVVEVTSTDVLTSLQTGLLDGFVNPPLGALALQWFGLAKNMVDFPFAPLVGATLVSKKQWEKIDPELRPKLKAIAERHMQQEQAKLRRLDSESVETMKKHGLKIHVPSAQERAGYEAAAQATWPMVREKIVPSDAFDLAIKARDELRAKRGQ